MPGGTMISGQLNNSGIITVDKEELYTIVKMAVYEALSQLDFLTLEEFKQRENAIKELEHGEAVHWQDYLKQRGLNS